MSDRRRRGAPTEGETGRAARFMLVALGLLGFVVFPGSWPLSSGPGIGMRTGAAQQPPVHQPPGRGRAAAVSGPAVRTASSPAETRSAVTTAPRQEASPAAEPAVLAAGAGPVPPRSRPLVAPRPRMAVPAGPGTPAFRERAPPAAAGS